MKIHSATNYLKTLLFIGAMLTLGAGPAWASPKDSPWGADYFPNLELVDQNGNKLRFYDDLIKDKVVIINFIFTHCGDSCPMQTANLRQVYKLLGDRMGKDIFFYSISIDPQHDTPEILKAYAEKFGIPPDAGWRFLTGSEADTTRLRKVLGLFRSDADAERLEEHSISFVLGNERTGQWLKRSAFDEPKTLAWKIGKSMSRAPVAKKDSTLTSYANADKLAKRSLGEELFRSRCDACHSLDSEDGIGPALQGVTERRDRLWLARWLKEPDRMLQENDAIATALFNQYGKLPMPNLRLADSDVNALITFLEKK